MIFLLVRPCVRWLTTILITLGSIYTKLSLALSTWSEALGRESSGREPDFVPRRFNKVCRMCYLASVNLVRLGIGHGFVLIRSQFSVQNNQFAGGTTALQPKLIGQYIDHRVSYWSMSLFWKFDDVMRLYSIEFLLMSLNFQDNWLIRYSVINCIVPPENWLFCTENWLLTKKTCRTYWMDWQKPWLKINLPIQPSLEGTKIGLWGKK